LFENLFERTCTPRKRNKAIGQLGHEFLALLHVFDYLQVRQSLVRNLPLPKSARNDASDLPTGPKNFIG
jgi:hypothetical protein